MEVDNVDLFHKMEDNGCGAHPFDSDNLKLFAMITTTTPEELIEALYHGREEAYLEYKGDVPWDDRAKKLDITQTVFALANEKDGGIIVIGVDDTGILTGVSPENMETYSHDYLNAFIQGRGNQTIECKLSIHKHQKEGDDEELAFVFIQVSPCREFPLVYTGSIELINKQADSRPSNIGLRKGALYIRNKTSIGNKEIQTAQEWRELVENTYKKYEKESLRRYDIVRNDQEQVSYDDEISI